MSEDNRSNLLNHALRLFARRGYDAVSVQEVVDAAGVTKPTLYHYFGSKSGLLEALFCERLSGLERSIAEAARFSGDLTMNLRNLAKVYFTFALQQPLLYQFLLSAQYAPRESDSFRAAADYHERVFEKIHAMFQAALPHMPDRHRKYAVTFIGMLNTYITLALNDYLDLDDTLTYQAVHQFMHGIFS